MAARSKDDIEAYLARIRKTIEASQALVSQTELRIAETDRMLAEQGLTREQVMGFQFTSEQKLKVNEELKRRGLPPIEDDEPDDMADLENRQKKFSMMMKPFQL